MRLQQLLEQSVSASLLNDSHRRFPILCFKQSDPIRIVLEKLAIEGLVSALVVSDTASADQDNTKTEDQNAANRMFSRVLVNDLKGFIDLSVILQSFLRRMSQLVMSDSGMACFFVPACPTRQGAHVLHKLRCWLSLKLVSVGICTVLV